MRLRRCQLRRDDMFMKIVPYAHLRWVQEHDKLICRYLKEHENEWRNKRGGRRLLARLRAEFRAWKYAAKHLPSDKDEPHKLY